MQRSIILAALALAVVAAWIWTEPLEAQDEAGFVHIEGGSFHMGSERHYPEEGPEQQPAERGVGSNHIGFRIVMDVE